MQKYLLPIWLLTLTNVHLLCSCNRQKSIYLYELQNLEVLYRSNFRKNQKLHLQYKLLNLVFLFFLGFYNKNNNGIKPLKVNESHTSNSQ